MVAQLGPGHDWSGATERRAGKGEKGEQENACVILLPREETTSLHYLYSVTNRNSRFPKFVRPSRCVNFNIG